MSELRWNPISEEWVIMATERQERPVFPKDRCPFDPGASEEMPDGYDLLAIPNRFPSLRRVPPAPTMDGDVFFKVAPAQGVCEVVLYSGDHDTVLEDKPLYHIKKLIDLWQNRYIELGEELFVKYVFIFENRGKEIGVTISHPHGQIYAYPFIPPLIESRLKGSRKFHEEEGRCLFCEIIAREGSGPQQDRL